MSKPLEFYCSQNMSKPLGFSDVDDLLRLFHGFLRLLDGL